MKKLDQLFIRACKANNPNKRLQSVYRRFYLGDGSDCKPHVIRILGKICDDYSLLSIVDFIDKQAQMSWIDGDANKPLEAIVSTIRFSPTCIFEGLGAPLKFRLRQARKKECG